MSIKSLITQTVRKATGQPSARVLTVARATTLTPNMIRVTLTGDDLVGFPEGREGGNCKLLIPAPDETLDAFRERLVSGPKPVRRTYTVRHYRADARELDIDFVAHGDHGPASRFAQHAKPGDFIGFMGPSPAKVTHFEADWYLLAADLSALPVVAATLEAMPADAKGVALFEIPDAEDRQALTAPPGIEQKWLVQPSPHVASDVQLDALMALTIPDGRIQTCIAGETTTVKKIRKFLNQRVPLQRGDAYVSGYWRMGLVEDEHQREKRAGG